MPITRLPGQIIRSGSVPTTALSGGVVSSSAQVTVLLPNGVVSSSGQIDHNSTTNYSANRHIDHTAVSITAGTGLSGGGDISTTRTLSIDSTVVTLTGAQSLSNKTITSASNTITGLTNANLSGTAGITNANLANSTISGVALGSNLNALTISSPLAGTSYNGSAATTIALASGYGDTQNPFASKTANTFLAAPNGSAGVPTFRSIVAADIPTLNQNTTGTASFATSASFATTSSFSRSGSFATTASFASNAGVTVSSTSANQTFYPLLFNATSGTTSTASVDTGWTFNPSTNAMSVPGSIQMGDATLLQPQLSDYSEQYTAGGIITGGTLNISVASAHVWRVSRNANITTLNITAGAPNNQAQSFTLIFDANGSSYTITWPAAVKWPGGTAPTITTTNGRSDMFVFYTNNAGTTWYAMTAAQNFVTT